MNSPILGMKVIAQRKRYLVLCFKCRRERWVRRDHYGVAPNAICGYCQRAQNNKSKSEATLAKIKKLLVCDRCGSRAFYEDEEGWGCIICGRIIYKDRVKLANLVKV